MDGSRECTAAGRACGDDPSLPANAPGASLPSLEASSQLQAAGAERRGRSPAASSRETERGVREAAAAAGLQSVALRERK